MKIEFLNCPIDLKEKKSEAIKSLVTDFVQTFELLEMEKIFVLTDLCTDSFFCECHITAKDLISKGTIDVPLDPENQAEYRANREVIETHNAYQKMVEDAKKKRMFSNIVCEFNKDYEGERPLKIIGGQHRYLAVQEALKNGVNEHHGIKIYFGLNTEQRLDVQLISNTNIAVSSDLLDRMYETFKGPELRTWCQETGLLDLGLDFTDRKQRGSQISVRGARTFIMNYYLGKKIDSKNFDVIDTTPVLAKTGVIIDEEWDKLRQNEPDLWFNSKLKKAAEKFAELNKSQSDYFLKKKDKTEWADKAISYPMISAWAFISGVLENNQIRLKKHFDLSLVTQTDPLNALVLTKAKHRTDPENYRGLGTRADAKERGRLSELFFIQAEKGEGINKSVVDLAIKKYHAKQANLEVQAAEKSL